MFCKKNFRDVYKYGILFLAAYVSLATSQVKKSHLQGGSPYNVDSDCPDAEEQYGQLTFKNNSFPGAQKFGLPSDELTGNSQSTSASTATTISSNGVRECIAYNFSDDKNFFMFVCTEDSEIICTVSFKR